MYRLYKRLNLIPLSLSLLLLMKYLGTLISCWCVTCMYTPNVFKTSQKPYCLVYLLRYVSNPCVNHFCNEINSSQRLDECKLFIRQCDCYRREDCAAVPGRADIYEWPQLLSDTTRVQLRQHWPRSVWLYLCLPACVSVSVSVSMRTRAPACVRSYASLYVCGHYKIEMSDDADTLRGHSVRTLCDTLRYTFGHSALHTAWHSNSL